MFTPAKAALIAIILECIIYGVYFTVFLRTVPVLCQKMAPGIVRAYLAGTALALFTLITMKLGVDINVAVEFFTNLGGITPLTGGEAKLSSGVYVALTMIADTFIVYRLFAVWSRSLVSVIPCLLIIAGIITGGLMAAHASELSFKEPQASGLLTAFYCITLVLNVLCTALIAFKLYIEERRNELSSPLRLRWTSVVVIQSAALYSACVVAVVVCNIVGADSVHIIVLSSTPSIIGLTFSLIIFRIGSSGTPHKPFTSIEEVTISRGSVLQYTTEHRTINGDEVDLNIRSNSQTSEKVTVAPTTPATVQLKPVPSNSALTDDIEQQVGRDVIEYRQ
ncbi:hypothetical protein PM082_014108 [Marasmius tenuissimus]|nr:hypothetical protein PM082_014108 [Marasmius tenuissimus]